MPEGDLADPSAGDDHRVTYLLGTPPAFEGTIRVVSLIRL